MARFYQASRTRSSRSSPYSLPIRSGIILISHQSGFLQTSGNQLLNDLLIIILIIIVATIRIRLEDLLTQITLIGVLKERHHARIMEVNTHLPSRPFSWAVCAALTITSSGRPDKSSLLSITNWKSLVSFRVFCPKVSWSMDIFSFSSRNFACLSSGRLAPPRTKLL